jgi:hypothetical protein
VSRISWFFDLVITDYAYLKTSKPSLHLLEMVHLAIFLLGVQLHHLLELTGKLFLLVFGLHAGFVFWVEVGIGQDVLDKTRITN